jgi:phospholipid/cholesterol/gamma-HCH transport system substrate-binding protein
VSRRTLINLVFFNGVFLVMLVWAAGNLVTIDRLEHPYTITGDFIQASGVRANAEVTYLGVHYGRVSDVARRPEGVRITMKIDKGKDIPSGSIARVFRKSAIGEPYIDFRPPDDFTKGGPRIEPGANVPLSRTTVPLEFSELLRSASDVISSIDPQAAGDLVHELSLALDGRGDSLRTLTASIDQITSSFVERTDQLDRLAENSTRVTKVVADHRLSLGRSITNLRAIAETLRDANGDTQVLLDVGPDFLRTTADLVADQKRNLDCLLTDLAPILRTINGDQQLSDLAQTLQNGPLAFGYVASTVQQEADGPWVRINLIVPTDGANPKVYVPPKGLPVVPTVAPCASTLTPAAVAATPSPAAPPAEHRTDLDTSQEAPGPASSPDTSLIARTLDEPQVALPALVVLLLALGQVARVIGRRRRTRAAVR